MDGDDTAAPKVATIAATATAPASAASAPTAVSCSGAEGGGSVATTGAAASSATLAKHHAFPGCSHIEAYSVVRVVGEGTFGEVHLGRHIATHRPVALKRLRMEKEKEGFPITAIREIKLLKRLCHENIVPLLEIAVCRHDSGRVQEIYMVFPYFEHDLNGLIDTPSFAFTIPIIKSFARQLLLGLNYLHTNYILHRDIKTANLLVNVRGALRVADFGLARAIEPRTNSQMRPPPLTGVVVTRWYRPPELLLGCTTYGPAIDVWGAGCVIAEMLRRSALFPGSSDSNQLECIYRVCGTPDETTWPGWDVLINPASRAGGATDPKKEGAATMPPEQEQHKRCILDVFQGYLIAANLPRDQLLINLLDHLLVPFPDARPTAAKALENEWFLAIPHPLLPGLDNFNLPRNDCHEYEARRSRSRGNQPPDRDRDRPSGPPMFRGDHYTGGRAQYLRTRTASTSHVARGYHNHRGSVQPNNHHRQNRVNIATSSSHQHYTNRPNYHQHQPQNSMQTHPHQSHRHQSGAPPQQTVALKPNENSMPP